jgi:hypothetical protein
MDQVALGQVFSEYYGFRCQYFFHKILHPHNHPGQLQKVSSGQRSDWTHYGLHPHSPSPQLCELNRRELYRSRIIENRYLRETFSAKRKEVTGGYRKLDEDLIIYTSHQIYEDHKIKNNEMDELCSTHGKGHKSEQNLVG